MIPPSRTLGVAFSDGDRVSRIAGAVCRADGTLDGLAYGACAVGGTDATRAVRSLVADLGREDVRHVSLAGVAPAWYNLVDLKTLQAAVDRPVTAVSYEVSDGLAPALREAFDGEALATRLSTYRSLPPRHRVEVPDGEPSDAESTSPATGRSTSPATGRSTSPATGRSTSPATTADHGRDRAPLFVRAVGIDVDRAAAVVRSLVRAGFRRPEPLRIAAIAASAHRAATPDRIDSV